MSPAKRTPRAPRVSAILLRIVALEGTLPDVTVTVLPPEVRIDKKVIWTKQATSTADAPHLQFSSGEGRIVSMELTFDNSATKTSVAPAAAALFAMTQIIDTNSSEDLKRPPLLALRWTGDTLPDMKGVIEALSVRYVEFAADGTPVKAQAAVTFREASQVSFKRP